MKIKHGILCLLSILLLSFAAGCGKGNTPADVAGKSYVYTAYPEEADPAYASLRFTIRLGEDGTFSYSPSALSSYAGFGTWSVAGDVLTLTNWDPEETGDNLQNAFRIDGDDLVFIEQGSSNFTDIPIQVKDGERFTCVSPAKNGNEG